MKCGFLGCNDTQTREGKNCCQSCKERKEWNICWACQKARKESEEGYLYHSLPSIYHTAKSSYLMGEKFKKFSQSSLL